MPPLDSGTLGNELEISLHPDFSHQVSFPLFRTVLLFFFPISQLTYLKFPIFNEVYPGGHHAATLHTKLFLFSNSIDFLN
jgi:hypothetical protein